MADFSFLSDTDDSAVEELISQARDLSVLEQVSAINCSGFIDSALPTELDTRFRRLKSFPLSKPNPTKTSPPPSYLRITSLKPDFVSSKLKGKIEPDSSLSDEENVIFSPSNQNPDEKSGLEQKSRSGSVVSPSNSSNLASLKSKEKMESVSSPFGEENVIFSPSNQNPDEKNGLEKKSRSGSVVSPSNSSNLSRESAIFSGSKKNPDGKKGLELKSRDGYFHSPSGSSNSLMDSPSPPRKSGCFFCSPKRVLKKRSDKSGIAAVGLDWGKDEEILSDLSIISVKEQKRILKKAMKEEDKINREAEKIVKWAKQASARMNVSGFEDELSDNNSFK